MTLVTLIVQWTSFTGCLLGVLAFVRFQFAMATRHFFSSARFILWTERHAFRDKVMQFNCYSHLPPPPFCITWPNHASLPECKSEWEGDIGKYGSLLWLYLITCRDLGLTYYKTKHRRGGRGNVIFFLSPKIMFMLYFFSENFTEVTYVAE